MQHEIGTPHCYTTARHLVALIAHHSHFDCASMRSSARALLTLQRCAIVQNDWQLRCARPRQERTHLRSAVQNQKCLQLTYTQVSCKCQCVIVCHASDRAEPSTAFTKAKYHCWTTNKIPNKCTCAALYCFGLNRYNVSTQSPRGAAYAFTSLTHWRNTSCAR